MSQRAGATQSAAVRRTIAHSQLVAAGDTGAGVIGILVASIDKVTIPGRQQPLAVNNYAK